jgi:hypothetical protein
MHADKFLGFNIIPEGKPLSLPIANPKDAYLLLISFTPISP